MDAAAINWTLPLRSEAKISWRRSDACTDLLREREMRMRRDKTRDAVGRPSWRSSFLGDPGVKFLCGRLGNGKKRKAVGAVGDDKSFTGGTNGSEERMPA